MSVERRPAVRPAVLGRVRLGRYMGEGGAGRGNWELLEKTGFENALGNVFLGVYCSSTAIEDIQNEHSRLDNSNRQAITLVSHEPSMGGMACSQVIRIFMSPA